MIAVIIHKNVYFTFSIAFTLPNSRIMRNHRQIIMKSGLLLLLFLFLKVAYAQDNAPNESRWEETIQKFEEKDQAAPPPKKAILFVGSSSFVMWQDLNERFPDKTILNRAFGGSQMSDLLHFADRIILPYQPSQVLIYEGDNDISAGKSPKRIMKDAKALVKTIEEELPETQVAFVSVKPSLARWNLKQKFLKTNRKLKKYAQKKANVKYIDVWDAMLNENGKPIEDIFLQDGLHMNDKGYDIWTKEIGPHLK